MTTPDVSIIILAGGTGKRMQTAIPKQFMLLQQKPVILHSFEVFNRVPNAKEIVVVCDASFQAVCEQFPAALPIKFARPGLLRQDSAYNGFQECDPQAKIICIHDAARPFIALEWVQNVIQAANEVGAATAAVPMKSTVKEVDEYHHVVRTPNRESLWEIQTPQAIKRELLTEGFAMAMAQQKIVTDDTSLVELLGLPVKLVFGSYANLKITTPEDMYLAEMLAQR